MLWIGLLLAAIGGAMLYFSGKAAGRVLHMKATETAKIGELRKLMADVAKDLGGGPSELREFVEIKGTVGCDRPLQGELSGRDAVVVRTTVRREIEELREDTDSEGNTTSQWVSRTETLSSTDLDTPFWIDDGTGKIPVRPGGAAFTLQQVVDRFEQANSVQSGNQLSFGSLSLSLSPVRTGSTLRVKGFRFSEEILPVGARVYALGEVSDTSDGIALHKSQDADKPFVLSTKSEEEMVSAGESQAKGLKYGGLGAVGLGVVLVLVGAVQMALS
jgi:hypothetical protein